MASLDGNLLSALLKLAAVAGCCGLSEALPRAAAASIHHRARRPPLFMANGGKCHCACGCASVRHLTLRASGVWLAAVPGVEAWVAALKCGTHCARADMNVSVCIVPGPSVDDTKCV